MAIKQLTEHVPVYKNGHCMDAFSRGNNFLELVARTERGNYNHTSQTNIFHDRVESKICY